MQVNIFRKHTRTHNETIPSIYPSRQASHETYCALLFPADEESHAWTDLWHIQSQVLFKSTTQTLCEIVLCLWVTFHLCCATVVSTMKCYLLAFKPHKAHPRCWFCTILSNQSRVMMCSGQRGTACILFRVKSICSTAVTAWNSRQVISEVAEQSGGWLVAEKNSCPHTYHRQTAATTLAFRLQAPEWIRMPVSPV